MVVCCIAMYHEMKTNQPWIPYYIAYCIVQKKYFRIGIFSCAVNAVTQISIFLQRIKWISIDSPMTWTESEFFLFIFVSKYWI